MSKKIWFFIVLVVLAALAVGFFVGRKYDKQPAVEPSLLTKVDSLSKVNSLLQDSLAVVRADVKTVTRDVIKYRTTYDTITVSENTEELLINLRTIINTSIDER